MEKKGKVWDSALAYLRMGICASVGQGEGSNGPKGVWDCAVALWRREVMESVSQVTETSGILLLSAAQGMSESNLGAIVKHEAD